MISTLVKLEDVPADYISRELAVKWCNEKFTQWVQENQVCTHPVSKIKATKLNWELDKCDLYCDGCMKKMEVVKWIPANTQKNSP